MIRILLAILICIIILIALMCLWLVMSLLWQFKTSLVGSPGFFKGDKNEMDPISPEEQMRRKINRREE